MGWDDARRNSREIYKTVKQLSSREEKGYGRVWDEGMGRGYGTRVWDEGMGRGYGTRVWDEGMGRGYGTRVWDEGEEQRSEEQDKILCTRLHC